MKTFSRFHFILQFELLTVARVEEVAALSNELRRARAAESSLRRLDAVPGGARVRWTATLNRYFTSTALKTGMDG